MDAKMSHGPTWNNEETHIWTDNLSARKDTQERDCVLKGSETTKAYRTVFLQECILTKASQHCLNAKCTLSVLTHLICNTLFTPQRKHLHNKTAITWS